MAWTAAIPAHLIGRSGSLHHDALLEGAAPAWASLALFVLAWQLMIAAMMLPSSLPLIGLFDRASAAQPRAGRARLAFLGGYALVWTEFGILAFLLKHYRRGSREACRFGRKHGMFCLGCCWALMLVSFAVGVANLLWMGALTLLMVFERTGRGGDRGVVPIGICFMTLGALVLIGPSWLPAIFSTS